MSQNGAELSDNASLYQAANNGKDFFFRQIRLFANRFERSLCERDVALNEVYDFLFNSV
jgi:hypothetical protein